jgi:hypothetical protein
MAWKDEFTDEGNRQIRNERPTRLDNPCSVGRPLRS